MFLSPQDLLGKHWLKWSVFPQPCLPLPAPEEKPDNFLTYFFSPRNMDRGLAWSVIPIAGILLWTLQLLARAAWTGSALSQVLSR